MSQEPECQNPAEERGAEVGASTGGVRVYAWGYQGRNIEDLVRLVRYHGIQQLLDVRENASSKKAGFSAEELAKELSRIGVAYIHLSELGCRRESRRALWRGEARESFLEDYRRELAVRPHAFADLVRRIQGTRTLLLCLEKDSSRCHRAVLVERLRAEGILAEEL
jgi:uncharacterized protein (DUF488 family)